MFWYSPGPDDLVSGEEKVSGDPGRLTPPGLRDAPAAGRELAGRLAGLALTGLAVTLIFLAPLPGLTAPRGLMADALDRAVAVLGLTTLVLLVAALGVTVLGLIALGLAAALGFAVVRGLAVVLALVVARALAVVRGFAVERDVAC